MELLLELVNLVRKSDPADVKLLVGDGRWEELWRQLENGRLTSDEEARRHFYGDDRFGQRYLYDIKNELHERLLNTLLCQSSPSTDSPALVAMRDCTKELALIQQLRGRGQSRIAARLAERTLRKAIKYQFTEVVVSLLRILYQYHALMGDDDRRYRQYRQLLTDYEKQRDQEWLVEEMFLTISRQQNRSKTVAGMVEKAEGYLPEIRSLMKRYPESHRIHLLGYSVLVNFYILSHQHREVIATCQEALAFFERLPYPAPLATLFSFTYRMIPSFIHLQRFEAAQDTIAAALQLMKPGIHNWFATQFYHIVLGFYAGKYLLSYRAMQEIRKYKLRQGTLREQLLIAEAYVVFFQRAGMIKAPALRFRMARFLNEVPTFSKDKRGMNINILILQILFLLLNRQYNSIIDRMEALAMYSHRYLRRDEHFRSNCFIKLLLLLPKNDFNYRRLAAMAAPLLEKLRTVPVLADYDVEIVPYLTLWEIVTGLLEEG